MNKERYYVIENIKTGIARFRKTVEGAEKLMNEYKKKGIQVKMYIKYI